VRDEKAFGTLIDQIYSTYGRLDGVIHGAGVIEDKLIKDKTIESFDRVFDTKAISGFILARKLRPETLKFFVFFSSVAGRFGNRGQGDYAAANEVINKLALHLDRHWPGRILAINWGPWAGSGMVTPELEKEFDRRGIGLITRDLGPRILDHELCYGQKGDVEIIVGGVEDWQKQKHLGGS
jgi:NAD(P)-dependent dehydrogenase (short-subunit alcohol dehydrogenase family)